jgi:hypothetical protein
MNTAISTHQGLKPIAFTNAYSTTEVLAEKCENASVSVVMLSGARPGFGRAESKHPYSTNELWVQ